MSGHADAEFSRIWQQAQHGWFYGKDKVKIHHSYWLNSKATASLLLVPGRIEAGHKYAEFIADALASGYQVFVLDHRGQGASERLQADPQLGYVRHFSDYADDLQKFIKTIITPINTLPMLAVAHSMGGAILTNYLQSERQSQIRAAVFSSPMWGIDTSPIPDSLALPLAKSISGLNSLLSKKPWYLPGQGPYQNRPFSNNDLTLSAERYQWFRQLYQHNPLYQLGGVSWHWLCEALKICQQFQQQQAPDMPCFLLQGAADAVVSNHQQLALWQQWQQQAGFMPAVTIANARHELLNETDEVRRQWFMAVNQFLKQV
jgi:lysophospholipase